MDIPSPTPYFFLVAAVSLCSLPSSTYLNLIGYPIWATAAA